MTQDPYDLGNEIMIITKSAWEKQRYQLARARAENRRLRQLIAMPSAETKRRIDAIIDEDREAIQERDKEIKRLQAIVDDQRERIVNDRFDLEITTDILKDWTAKLKAMRAGTPDAA